MRALPSTVCNSEDASQVVLCSPVAAQIHFGLSRLASGSLRRTLLEAEFARLRKILRWANWDALAARRFGHWKARLQRRGMIIEDFDLAIASVALDLEARLATRNFGHFARIEELTVEDWSPGRP